MSKRIGFYSGSCQDKLGIEWTPSLEWPECFITGVIPPNVSDKELHADALIAWGNCMSGLAGPPPKKFGEVMAIIANRLGVLGTPETFLNLDT